MYVLWCDNDNVDQSNADKNVIEWLKKFIQQSCEVKIIPRFEMKIDNQ